MGKVALGLAAVATLAGAMVGAGSANAEAGPDGSLYGSIAILEYTDDTEDWHAAYNYPNWDEADRDALNDCGDSKYCHIAVRFKDGCGAVAKTSGSNARYFWGTAATRFEAERQAIAGATRPGTMSSAGSQGILVVSKCTDNAR
ncbi:DUF4189 domain-containing protein [Nocardia sp. NPDC058058]|uniref:DUF4189 domain-containing protein n=1 Tax=Nocardia sp. NPDC058058 TaxID=3346317 RepID=UPI0036DB711C